MQNKTILVILAVLLVITAAAAIVINQRSEVVAIVNGEKITKDQLYEAFLANGGNTVLEQLISDRIIQQEAAKLGLKVTNTEVEAEIEKLIQENYYGNEEYYQQVLTQYGITEDALKNSIRTELLLTAIVRNKIEVTDQEVEDYFRENQEDFNIPEKINVRHILVESEEEAKEILTLLNEGEDFAELAKEHSLDPGSAAEGGALGFVGRGQFVQEFEDAAFALEVGQYSKPVKSEYGYHIIEVLERQEAREVEFSEVAEDVKKTLIEEKVKEKIVEEYNALREAAEVETRL
ncbi:MAG: foldase [Firmicutes bacterium]|nr:foldase [Bacillota bacterium]